VNPNAKLAEFSRTEATDTSLRPMSVAEKSEFRRGALPIQRISFEQKTPTCIVAGWRIGTSSLPEGSPFRCKSLASERARVAPATQKSALLAIGIL
jgi:hypothetical protein